MRPLVLLCIVLGSSLSGCFGFLDELTRPDYSVASTPLQEGMDAWNTDNRFRVVVEEGVGIEITARELDTGQVVQESGRADVTVQVPDGRWRITYVVDGHKWDTLSPVRIDATAPEIVGLEYVGTADGQGVFTIGSQATPEPGSQVRVLDANTLTVLGRSLPHRVSGLNDGLHVFLVQAEDAAGNVFNQTVQVRAGAAAALPDGTYTYGVVARYTNEVRVWDISDLSAYATVASAQAATGGRYLDAGHGIDPQSPCVTAVVDALIVPSMTTAERAHVLFEWLFDNLEYDDERLVTDTLLQPCQVIADREDPLDRDDDGDGLVRDGNGNGVHGGICRDLAATYVSLLRAADVPARLVSGYLAGEVNGFHAWVEFYGGAVQGQSPWVPVDVSIIDGRYDEGKMMQAFAIQLPEYLALRTVPDDAEVQGWSTALSMHFTWESGGNDAPEVSFEKSVTPVFENSGVLCVHRTTDTQTGTRARMVGQSESDCAGPKFNALIPSFVRRTERIIDYGILVSHAPPTTQIHAEVAYPFPESIEPDTVSFVHYGPAFVLDPHSGKAISDFRPYAGPASEGATPLESDLQVDGRRGPPSNERSSFHPPRPPAGGRTGAWWRRWGAREPWCA